MTYHIAVSDVDGRHETVAGGFGDLFAACIQALEWAGRLSAVSETDRDDVLRKVDIIDAIGRVTLSIALPIEAPLRRSDDRTA